MKNAIGDLIGLALTLQIILDSIVIWETMGDLGLIPGSGRSPRVRNGNPLQYCCLENSLNRGAWWATVHGVAKSQTRLSDFTEQGTADSCIGGK